MRCHRPYLHFTPAEEYHIRFAQKNGWRHGEMTMYFFVIIGVLQIRILVIFSLTSGYQPILTKFSANVAYFSKLNLPFLPKITNELISDI